LKFLNDDGLRKFLKAFTDKLKGIVVTLDGKQDITGDKTFKSPIKVDEFYSATPNGTIKSNNPMFVNGGIHSNGDIVAESANIEVGGIIRGIAENPPGSNQNPVGAPYGFNLFNNGRIFNVVDPVDPQDVATKKYVDEKVKQLYQHLLRIDVYPTSGSTTNLVSMTISWIDANSTLISSWSDFITLWKNYATQRGITQILPINGLDINSNTVSILMYMEIPNGGWAPGQTGPRVNYRSIANVSGNRILNPDLNTTVNYAQVIPL